VFLAICGAYQLLGQEFITGDNVIIKGAGILDITTKAPSSSVKQRCTGDIIGILNPEIFNLEKIFPTIVGFENHSGQTYISNKMNPFAIVKKGFGNNSHEKIEGCVYKNLIGTYLHGSFLPKNPHICDFLILNALKQKYKRKIKLQELDDKDEIEAHKYILSRYNVSF